MVTALLLALREIQPAVYAQRFALTVQYATEELVVQQQKSTYLYVKTQYAMSVRRGTPIGRSTPRRLLQRAADSITLCDTGTLQNPKRHVGEVHGPIPVYYY
jgi:hypothetical protein